MLHGGGGLHPLLGIETLQITLLTTTPHIIGPDKAELSLTLVIRRSRYVGPEAIGPTEVGPRPNPLFPAFFCAQESWK